MEPWQCQIGGVAGCFCWVVDGEPGNVLGPILPFLFESFRRNAWERAALCFKDPCQTSLLWISLEEPRAGEAQAVRRVGSLREVDSLQRCAEWIRATRERDALDREVDAAMRGVGSRRL